MGEHAARFRAPALCIQCLVINSEVLVETTWKYEMEKKFGHIKVVGVPPGLKVVHKGSVCLSVKVLG